MKRILKYVALIVVVVIVAIAAVFVASIAPLQSAPASEVADGVHFVLDRSNVAIVPAGPNQVLLVDSGTDHAAANVLAELSKLGLTADSVVAILLTHGHYDHTGGARQFPKAALMALEPDVALLDGVKRSRGPVSQFLAMTPSGLKLTRVLHDGETLTVGQKMVKVFAIPGHTSGSAAYLIDGVLFLGDSASSTKSGKLQSATWIVTDDLRQNEASLRSLDQRLLQGGEPVKAIAFGHTAVLEKGLAPLTEWAKDHPS